HHRTDGHPPGFLVAISRDSTGRAPGHCHGRRHSTLWTLETNWYGTVEGRCALNLLRNLPLIHVAMSRYRFVEDGLRIGKAETRAVIRDARANVKLWYRGAPGAGSAPPEADGGRTLEAVRHMLYPELQTALERTDADACPRCERHRPQGLVAEGRFGGVTLCEPCGSRWREYVLGAPARHAAQLTRRL
ncbi:hypothetical protein, partial [Kitasatospora sp. NPDC088346]|uniref:hypothetical protein n=1 Tax=Kitasatospora sp. NPDC088346 TaxID=3364073 RepID=UPI003807942D